MRKVILFMMVTLDGFFCGPNGEIDWHVVDEEFNEFANDQLGSVDTLLFGRVTYQGAKTSSYSAALALRYRCHTIFCVMVHSRKARKPGLDWV